MLTLSVNLTLNFEVFCSYRELRGPCHCLLMNLYLWSPQLLKTIRCCTSVFGSGQSADEQISQVGFFMVTKFKRKNLNLMDNLFWLRNSENGLKLHNKVKKNYMNCAGHSIQS